MICIVVLMFLGSLAGFIFVYKGHKKLKREFEDKQWMDNSEFDYGHDVRHDYKEY